MKRVLLSILIIITLVSCSSRTSKELPQQLRLNLGAEPSTLNPILATDATSSTVTGQLFNGLLRINDDLEIEPDLASTYNVSEDGLVYTFILRDDVTWHDGLPFSGEDVLFTYEKILDKTTNTVRRSGYVFDGKPVKFELLNAYTFRATLPVPYAPFLQKMTMDILPKHLYEDEDINTSSYNRNPIGTGPYVFKVWEPGQYIILEENENYHHGKPKIKSLLYRIILDPQAALISLRKQELDLDGIPPKDVAAMEAEKHLNIFSYYDLNYTYLGFNLKHPLLGNPYIRQAIAHAIDKKVLVGGVLKGRGRPADVPTSPLLWSYPDDIPTYAYDPDKSKRILESEGYVMNPETGYVEKDGQPLSFTILTNQGNKEREKVAQVIQHELKEVGIKVSIQILEWSSFLKIVNAHEDPKKYDAVILGWALSLDPDSYSIWHSSEYPDGFNFVGYQNPTVDTLLEQGRREISQEKRKVIYAEMYRHIALDLPYVFLYYPETSIGVHRRLKGLSKPGPGGILNRIEQVYIEP